MMKKTLLATLLAAATPLVIADVTVESITRTEGSGLMSMANMSVVSRTIVSGQRSRTDSELKMDSRMMKMLARGGPTAEIVRLDDGVVVSLDLKKQRYTQQSLAERREEMQKAMADAQKAQKSQQSTGTGVNEEQCQWSEPVTKVNKSGETARLAGFDTRRTSVTASQSCADPKSGSVCEFALTVDQWVAPSVKGSQEIMAFQRRYMEALGLSTQGGMDFVTRAEQSFGHYKGLWSGLAKELGKVEGYPLKSSFSLAVGGPKCTAQGQGGDGAPRGGVDVGKALGGLKGMFGGKKKDAEAAPPAAPTPARDDGLVDLMTISNEVTRIDTAGVAASSFEVPAGFKAK